jgi:TonB-linked SusC/RagA family outer membrane protein
MRRTRFDPGLAIALMSALLVAASGGEARAQGDPQNTVITGKVSGEQQEGLAGANVFIVELGIGTNTTPAGLYSLTIPADRVQGQTVTLTARFVGYAPVRRQITLTAGRQEQNFELRRDIQQLSAVVVTGVAEATETKKLPFAVGAVDAAQLRETPAVDALGGLAGKVAGVEVQSPNGQPGQETAIRLRSSTSLTGRQDPLVIIDGTITRLTLADINSEDIERIEVIKGAAASSLYGSDAANGVVQIFTKRGANLPEGQLVVTARNEYGQSRLPKTIPQSCAHAFLTNAAGDFVDKDGNVLPLGGARVLKADEIADVPFKTCRDHQADALTSGQFFTNYISVGQRMGNTNFNASFHNTEQQGILEFADGYSRRNFRLNIDQAFSPRFDVSVGAFFGRSNNDAPQQGPNGPFFGLMFVEPDVELHPDSANIRKFNLSSNAANPLYALRQIETSSTRSRYTGSARARYRLTDWLTAEGNFNYDQEGLEYRQVTPKGFQTGNGTPTAGGLVRQQINDRTYNTGATLTGTFTYGALRNTTKAAYIYEDQTGSDFNLTAGSFVVRGTPEFTAVDPALLLPQSLSEPIRNKNYFLVSTFDIKDRYILDGLVRRDESSLFGPESREQTYYRVSGAYRVSQDFQLPGIDELRLRASRGTAGLRPPFQAQYEAFAIVQGKPEKVTLGNPALKPAHSTENEIGINVDFLRRFNFEYTFSDKKTTDQILLVPLSAATGYQEQWRNAGTLVGKTHEWAIGGVLVDRDQFNWRLNITGDRTRQRITELSVAPFLVGPGYLTGNPDVDNVTTIFRIAPGQKFGVMYGARTVRSLSELYEDPAKRALMGPGQAWSPDSVLVNEQGYVVRRNAWRTPGERPIRYVNAQGQDIVEIGDVNPDVNLSFNTNLTWRGFAVSGVVNWVKGGNIYNGTRQWPFFEQRDRVYDQTHLPTPNCAGSTDPTCPYSTGKKPVNYYTFFYNSINPIDYFVEDGSYVKLKELSVNYTLPGSFLRRMRLGALSGAKIGIVGRNLFTNSDYSGYDPEVSGLAGDPFSFRFDGFSYPNFRTFTGVVELTF